MQLADAPKGFALQRASRWAGMLAPIAILLALATPGTSHAQDALVFDDAFLVISLHNDVNARGGNQPAEVHYRPQFRMRFFGAARGDAVKVVWKRGRRTLAEIRCPLESGGGDWRTSLSDRCWNRDEVRLDAHGDMSVELIFVDDSEESETLVRTLAVPVQRYWAFDRRVGRRAIHSPRYQVRGDDLLGLSYVWLAEPESHEPFGDVFFYFWATLPNDDTNYRSPSWRCRLNGERVPELDRGDNAVESISDIRVSDDRMVGNERATTHYAWRLMWVKPAMIWGSRNPSASSSVSSTRYNISEHPGDYVCQLRNEGEMVRELRFTIQDDGTVARHPAQGEGGISLRPGAFFVESRFPERNPVETSFDRDAVRRSVAFGRPWPDVAEVRAWLGSLPRSFGSTQPRPPRGAR